MSTRKTTNKSGAAPRAPAKPAPGTRAKSPVGEMGAEDESAGDARRSKDKAQNAPARSHR